MKRTLLSVEEVTQELGVSVQLIRRIRNMLRLDLERVQTNLFDERVATIVDHASRAGRHCRPRAGRPAPVW